LGTQKAQRKSLVGLCFLCFFLCAFYVPAAAHLPNLTSLAYSQSNISIDKSLSPDLACNRVARLNSLKGAQFSHRFVIDPINKPRSDDPDRSSAGSCEDPFFHPPEGSGLSARKSVIGAARYRSRY
jgi:hypothetical protein